MKITELRCTACNGTLKIDENNPNIAECEYCKTRYTIERDNDEARLREAPKIQYITPRPSAQMSGAGQKQDGGGKAALLIAGVLLAAAVVVGIPAYRAWKLSGIAQKAAGTVESAKAIGDIEDVDGQTKVPLSGCLGQMAAAAFGVPEEAVSQADLNRIQWIETRFTMDNYLVGYSFENPLENEAAELTWVEFSRDAERETACLSRFEGLKKLKLVQNVSEGDIEGLKLESIGGSYISPREAAEFIGDTEGIKELVITSGADSLDGLELFANLERLTVYGPDIADIREVVNSKSLKYLTLENFDSLRDFSVFSVMDGLESLMIESENLKSLDFLSGMKSLKQLGIADAAILNLDGLAARPELEVLRVES